MVKKYVYSRLWWCVPLTEAEAEGSVFGLLSEFQPELPRETVPQINIQISLPPLGLAELKTAQLECFSTVLLFYFYFLMARGLGGG